VASLQLPSNQPGVPSGRERNDGVALAGFEVARFPESLDLRFLLPAFHSRK